MSVDTCAFIKHNFSSKEALKLPEIISKWNNVGGLFLNFVTNGPENYRYNPKVLKPNWWNPTELKGINETHFEEYWKYHESQGRIGEVWKIFSPNLGCIWGDILVYKKVLRITPANHKYANLFHPKCGENIFILNRMIANHLETTKILYCSDSACPTALIDEKASEGMTIEELISFANKTFGKPPTEINEAIHNYYFIDDVNTPLQEIDPEKEVFKRWDYVDGKDVDRLGIWKGD